MSAESHWKCEEIFKIAVVIFSCSAEKSNWGNHCETFAYIPRNWYIKLCDGMYHLLSRKRFDWDLPVVNASCTALSERKMGCQISIYCSTFKLLQIESFAVPLRNFFLFILQLIFSETTTSAWVNLTSKNINLIYLKL